VSTPVLVYNRRAFRDAGLDPDRPPTSPDELRATAEQLVERGTVPVGFVFDTRSDGVPGWLVEHWGAQAGVAPLDIEGEAGGTAGRPAWEDGPVVDHFTWLEQMVADGLAASIGANAGGFADLTALVGERPRAAMAFHTSGALGELNDAVDTGLVERAELGVAPLPGPGRGSLPGGAALWLAAGQPADETRAAWSLAAYLASPEVQARLAAISGYAPVTEAAASLEPLRSTWVAHPHLAVPYEVLVALDTSQVELGISVGPEREIKELLAEALRATLRDGDPAAALAAAAADAHRLLDAYEDGLAAEDG
jgi:sn-glycerol 3-phosphate transport system substrate-binding protein